MKEVQAFADCSAAAVQELSGLLPADVREKVARKMKLGSQLVLACIGSGDGPPAVVLELVDAEGTRVHLVTVRGQQLARH